MDAVIAIRTYQETPDVSADFFESIGMRILAGAIRAWRELSTSLGAGVWGAEEAGRCDQACAVISRYRTLLASLAPRVPRLGENRCCARCREYQCEGIHIDALVDLCLGRLSEVHCVSCPADHCAGVQLKPA
jgi:hypothetical protein